MIENTLKIFFVNCEEDSFMSSVLPLRKEDKFVPGLTDDIVKFLQTEGSNYTAGFFHLGWLDILAGGSSKEKWKLVVDKLAKYKSNNQPWFIFTGGDRNIMEPFESECMSKTFLNSIYGKIKAGKIYTIESFYKKIGYI